MSRVTADPSETDLGIPLDIQEDRDRAEEFTDLTVPGSEQDDSYQADPDTLPVPSNDLEEHKKAADIDHPPGSVHLKHLETQVRALLEAFIQGDNEAVVREDVTFEKDVDVQGDISVAGGLDVAGDVDVTGDVKVDGAILLPAGLIFPFGNTSAPTGYLACDGSAVSRTTYAALFAAIGTVWGVGNGSTTFNVPDQRGGFLRGVGSHGSETMSAGGPYAGPAVGSFQGDLFHGKLPTAGPA